MRISDWSSDVCSSDLRRRRGDIEETAVGRRVMRPEQQAQGNAVGLEPRQFLAQPEHRNRIGTLQAFFQHAADRQPLDADALQQQLLARSEEHTSELQSLMRISYAVFCLKKKTH